MILSTDEITVSCWYEGSIRQNIPCILDTMYESVHKWDQCLCLDRYLVQIFHQTIYTMSTWHKKQCMILSTDELIVFELVQMSRYGGSVRLASYSANARDFLFPIPSRSLYHSSEIREIPLRRLIDFPVGCLLSVLSTQFNENLSSMGKNFKWL